MKTLLASLFGLFVLALLAAVFLFGGFGRTVLSGFRVLTGSGGPDLVDTAVQEDSADRTQQALVDRQKLARRLEAVEGQIDSHVDAVFGKMHEDMQKVREFLARNAGDTNIESEIRAADDLWQATYLFWSTEKSKQSDKDYDGILSGVHDVQERLRDLGKREGLPVDLTSEDVVADLLHARAERAALISEIDEKNDRLQRLADESKVKLARDLASLKEKTESQRNRNTAVLERNRSQQESAREQMQRLRDKMNR